jgi:trans-2,3-dihydro-3-hydroxyanthranilate isomerase
MPKEYTVAEYEDGAIVAGLAPSMEVLTETFGLLAFARNGGSVHSRFFAPVGGVDEDPATGSAAVALAAVLEAHGEASGSVVISQGDEIGTPSTIQLRWADGRASIGGTVVRDEERFLEI